MILLSGYEHYEVSSYALLDKSGDRGSVGGIVRPKSQHRSSHNSCYWAMKPFLAFGMGASSMMPSSSSDSSSASKLSRFARPSRMDAYERWVAIAEDLGVDAACALVTDLNDVQHAGMAAAVASGGGLEEAAQAPVAARVEDLDWGAAVTGGDEEDDFDGEFPDDDEAAAEAAAEEVLDELQEWLMVSLRTADGFDLDACAGRFGRPAAAAILTALEGAARNGLVVRSHPPPLPSFSSSSLPSSKEESTEEEQPLGVVRLTDPGGFLLSNDVISTIFAEMGEPELTDVI